MSLTTLTNYCEPRPDFGFLRLVDENWRSSIDGERIVQCLVVIMSLGHYVIKDSGLSFSPLIKLYFKYNILELFDRVLFS